MKKAFGVLFICLVTGCQTSFVQQLKEDDLTVLPGHRELTILNPHPTPASVYVNGNLIKSDLPAHVGYVRYLHLCASSEDIFIDIIPHDDSQKTVRYKVIGKKLGPTDDGERLRIPKDYFPTLASTAAH